jgi:rRNA maturation endonuclease Nob1
MRSRDKGIAMKKANILFEQRIKESKLTVESDEDLKCEMCGKSMTQKDHDFSDICGECSE